MTDEAAPSPGPEAPSARVPPRCLCMGLGPELTELVVKLSGSDDVCQQVRAAWIEVLRAVQALIDAHLASLTADRDRKGTRLTVE